MSTITYLSTVGIRRNQDDRFCVIHTPNGYLLAVFDGFLNDLTSDYCAKRLPEIVNEIEEIFIEHNNEYGFLRTIIKTLSDETVFFDLSGTTVSLVDVDIHEGIIDVAVLGDSPVLVRSQMNGTWVSPSHNVRSNNTERERVLSLGAGVYNGYVTCSRDIGQYDRCLQLTRALGAHYFDEFLIDEPECFSFPIHDDTVVAIMSDGIYDGRTISRSGNLVDVTIDNAEDLVNGALERGSIDNITAIVWKA